MYVGPAHLDTSMMMFRFDDNGGEILSGETQWSNRTKKKKKELNTRRGSNPRPTDTVTNDRSLSRYHCATSASG